MSAIEVTAQHEGGGVLEAFSTTLLPAVAMTIGSAAISIGSPPEAWQVCLQHLSAGLLIGAIVTDIFPILKAGLYTTVGSTTTVNWYSLLAAVIGFSGAMIVMYGVKSLGLEEEGDRESAAGSPGTPQNKAIPATPENLSAPLLPGGGRGAPVVGASAVPVGAEDSGRLQVAFSRLSVHADTLTALVATEQVDREAVDEEVHGIDFLVDSARRICRGAEPIDKRNATRLRYHASELAEDIRSLNGLNLQNVGSIDAQLRVVAGTLRHIHAHAERATFRRWAVQRRWRVESHDHADIEQATSLELLPLPWGLILAVIIDSVIDGMLIGLASSVAKESGFLMAIATAIEMGFLGYSFSCSLVKSAKCSLMVGILALPPLAMLAASSAAACGAAYVEGEPAFVGLVAFALVALLFLVVDELLAEAKEEEGSDSWRVGMWLYIGLFVSIALDVLI